MDLNIEDMIIQYGPIAVLVGTAVEGDVTMILAGVAAHLGLIDYSVAVGMGAVGGFASDVAFYTVGRHGNVAIRNSWAYRQAGPTIERLADRVGIWQIALSRFVYGTRIATMILWGLRGLSLSRFVLVDAVGCALWAVLLGGLGYLTSDSAAAVLGHVRRAKLWLMGALVVFAVLFASFHILFRWRRRRSAGEARGAS